ncbi:hypothetical protein [Streptomyces sp. CBMA123]|uniref:hypothetical protein n=1 Tax=Streptomyces sp. CBMA123 TaxID=1896313 RepID=UPI001661F75B|nr:hypothetical protein [Streptomyces sp. CBMA123]MBD0688465.1 hypothetical protein [Streptomyces sp. CBMA123]
MYSYDVSAPAGRSATAPRSIPSMRPSYDAEHPHSTTPIYDELYSEYRRLFRALPGDRSGEEDLRFTGFAIRDGYPLLGEQRPYPPPQHQTFHTHAGQPSGLPQFMPTQSQHSHGQNHAQSHGQSHGQNHGQSRPYAPPHGHGHAHPEPVAATAATSDGHGQAVPPSPQFTNGQGWVAAGYLGAVPHTVPAPPPPSPVLGTATGLATAPSPTGGRHRQMLSLPPGRVGDHH